MLVCVPLVAVASMFAITITHGFISFIELA